MHYHSHQLELEFFFRDLLFVHLGFFFLIFFVFGTFSLLHLLVAVFFVLPVLGPLFLFPLSLLSLLLLLQLLQVVLFFFEDFGEHVGAHVKHIREFYS